MSVHTYRLRVNARHHHSDGPFDRQNESGTHCVRQCRFGGDGHGHEDSTYKWVSILERKRKLPLVFVAPYHCLM